MIHCAFTTIRHPAGVVLYAAATETIHTNKNMLICGDVTSGCCRWTDPLDKSIWRKMNSDHLFTLSVTHSPVRASRMLQFSPVSTLDDSAPHSLHPVQTDKTGRWMACSTLTQKVCNPSVSTVMTVFGDLIGGFTHLLCFTSLSV